MSFFQVCSSQAVVEPHVNERAEAEDLSAVRGGKSPRQAVCGKVEGLLRMFRDRLAFDFYFLL